ncbi:MAG: hypothetical protein WAQ53_05095 [Thiofilum sp.]|uniref:anthrax toxin lethal factor-related metalloendopeptidase n=1 Tax=Thiofilum sp. TaxID=2212733 RepID=UPI0025EF3FA0|nr:hypothetical protein [Thiofilum sp.]MBK8452299.1 hypothetical protein [Thiofilum sp.]
MALTRALLPYLLVILSLLGMSLARADTTEIRTHTIRGWSIYYDAQLVKQETKTLLRTFVLLDDKLEQISALLPQAALEQLQQVPIWISQHQGKGLVYHASATWLLTHGRNPKLARSIEVQHLEDFATWSENQPLVLLHELAHALHHQVFNYHNTLINKAFQQAKKDHLYQSVQRYDGSYAPAYALENEREYFAELTESYFGRNDYYPFNRQQLKDYDPVGYQMIESIWYSDLAPTNDTPTLEANSADFAPAATHAP